MDVFNFHEFFSSQNLLPYNYFGGSACLTGCYHLKVPILRKKMPPTPVLQPIHFQLQRKPLY